MKGNHRVFLPLNRGAGAVYYKSIKKKASLALAPMKSHLLHGQERLHRLSAVSLSETAGIA
jgi:hypothetical protein